MLVHMTNTIFFLKVLTEQIRQAAQEQLSYRVNDFLGQLRNMDKGHHTWTWPPVKQAQRYHKTPYFW